jgi:hypothetical protein
MKLNNVVIEWAKLASPDDNGRYSVTILPNPAQQKELEEYLNNIWVEEYGAKKTPAWLGGRKELEGGKVRFVATRKAKRLVNEVEVDNRPKIVNALAVAYPANEVPRVSNGAIANLSLHGYITEYQGKKGVSLGLNGVQLVKFEEWLMDDEFEPIQEEFPDFEVVRKVNDPISDDQFILFSKTAAKNGWTAKKQTEIFKHFDAESIKDVDQEVYENLLELVKQPAPVEATK